MGKTTIFQRTVQPWQATLPKWPWNEWNGFWKIDIFPFSYLTIATKQYFGLDWEQIPWKLWPASLMV
jgi:hypothetical protein